MIVYGDLRRVEETSAKLERIQSGLSALEGMLPGIGRHAAIVALLVEAGELAEWAEVHGRHYGTPRQEVAGALELKFQQSAFSRLIIAAAPSAALLKNVLRVVSIFAPPIFPR